jgi:hypothetical protein
MKMTVIADKDGKVISTYRQPKKPGQNDPTFQLHGGPDHTIHELELPSEYEKIEPVEELHRRLGEHLKKASPKRG